MKSSNFMEFEDVYIFQLLHALEIIVVQFFAKLLSLMDILYSLNPI